MRFDTRRAGSLVLLALTLALPGCEREPAPPPASVPAPFLDSMRATAGEEGRTAEKRDSGRPAAAPAVDRLGLPQAPVAESSIRQRYLAVRHDLAVFTAADRVEAAWKAAEAACLEAGCEVLASSIAHDDERYPANAVLNARVPPAALPAFLERLGGLGTIGRHSTTAEDKTDEVVDTEARLKNMAEFRNNLRALMATPNAKLKDLIEVERELTRVQSELDSLATRRKVLANDTEKVRVSVAFAAKPSVLEAGMWSPVRTAVLRAGRVLAGSVAALIGFAVAVLPWALVLGAGAVGVRALLRRRRRLAAG